MMGNSLKVPRWLSASSRRMSAHNHRKKGTPMPKPPISLLGSVTLTLAVMPFVAVAAHAEIFTLQEALAIAYETNPRLEAERANLRATDEEVAKAVSGFRPNLGVSGTYGW